MLLEDWIALASGAALAAGVGSLAAEGLQGGALEGIQECRFVCPRFHEAVCCQMLQDMRTGQWKDVRSCTAFAEPEKMLCEKECATRLNLGWRLAGAP